MFNSHHFAIEWTMDVSVVGARHQSNRPPNSFFLFFFLSLVFFFLMFNLKNKQNKQTKQQNRERKQVVVDLYSATTLLQQCWKYFSSKDERTCSSYFVCFIEQTRVPSFFILCVTLSLFEPQLQQWAHINILIRQETLPLKQYNLSLSLCGSSRHGNP